MLGKKFLRQSVQGGQPVVSANVISKISLSACSCVDPGPRLAGVCLWDKGGAWHSAVVPLIILWYYLHEVKKRLCNKK